MADTPPVAQGERHPAALRTVLLAAMCWRLAEGASRGALIALGSQTAVAGATVTWFVLLSSVPIGWLCDRWWGERRTATVGGWLIAASVATAALGAFLPTVYGSLVLASLGSIVLRISLPMVLGGAYAGDDRRRLTAFMWLEGASSLGLLAASLFLKYVERDFGLWAFALPTVSVAAAAWALRHLPSESAGISGTEQSPVARGGGALRIAVQTFAAAAALTAILVVMSDTFDVRALPRFVLPTAALIVAVAFFIWAHRTFPAPATRAAVRTLAVVTAAGVAFWAFNPVSVGWVSVRIDALRLVNLTALFKVGAALVLIVIWRRFSRTNLGSTATALGLSFVLLGCALIVVGIVGRDDTETPSPLLVYTLTAAGNVLISAGAVNAATSLSPRNTAGRMLAVWYLTPSIAGLAAYLDRSIEPSVVVPAVVAATLFIALLFLPNRDTSARGGVYPRLVIAGPGWIRKTALALSGTIAVASVVWLAIGTEEPADASALATVPPPTFRGADSAFLPDDADLGFVLLNPGSSISVGQIATNTPPRGRDETPSVEVALRPFAIGKFEVTVAQYRQCVTEYGCQPADARATTGGDDLPVRHISWTEALQYCQWLEKKLARMQTGGIGALLSAGARVTLPSEAEWEATSLNLKDTPWAGPLVPTRANYADSGRLGPVRVGEFSAGAAYQGMQDLLGNVAEWTRSEYRSYPYNPDDGRENTTNMSAARVIRGGSFYDGPSLVRMSARRAADPSRGYDFVGFRVAIAQTSTSVSPGSAGSPAAAPPAAK